MCRLTIVANPHIATQIGGHEKGVLVNFIVIGERDAAGRISVETGPVVLRQIVAHYEGGTVQLPILIGGQCFGNVA